MNGHEYELSAREMGVLVAACWPAQPARLPSLPPKPLVPALPPMCELFFSCIRTQQIDIICVSELIRQEATGWIN